MAKINLNSLTRDNTMEYYETVIDQLWGSKDVETIIDFIDTPGNKVKIKKLLPFIHKKIDFIENNKEFIVETILANDLFSFLTDSEIEKIEKKFKSKKNEKFLQQLEKFIKTNLKKTKIDNQTYFLDINEDKISLPIFEEEFFKSLEISKVEITIFNFGGEYDIDVDLYLKCIPDYFVEHSLTILINNEYNVEMVNFSLDENLYDEDDDEYDQDLFNENFFNLSMMTLELEAKIYEFINAVNAHNLKNINSLFDKNFVYNDEFGQLKNKNDLRKEFEENFKNFPNFSIEILDSSMGESSKFYFSVLIHKATSNIESKNNIYFAKSPAIFIFEFLDDKIISLEVFSKRKNVFEKAEIIELK